MKKAIGGLLVVSMLSMPQAIDLSYIAYIALRSHNRVMYVHFITDEDKKASPADVDLAMAGLNENQRVIAQLLRERAATLTRLEARLDLLRHTKTALNEEQMTGYAAFMSRYKEYRRDFSGLLKTIDAGKSLNAAQKEILNENTDYNLVVRRLNDVISVQNMAIDNLSRTVYEGELMLKAL